MEKATTAGAIAPVEVDWNGYRFTVDRKRLSSWKAFEYASVMESGAMTEKCMAAVDFAAYVTNSEREDIVKAVGGDDAPTTDVVTLAMRIITEAQAKNS